MSDLDSLLAHCLAAPADAVQRGILCDALATANETELEAALRSEHGEAIVRRVWALADQLKRTACVRLLWAVVVCDANPSLFTAPPMTDVMLDELRRQMGEARRVVTLPYAPGDYEVRPDWMYKPPKPGDQRWGDVTCDDGTPK